MRISKYENDSGFMIPFITDRVAVFFNGKPVDNWLTADDKMNSLTYCLVDKQGAILTHVLEDGEVVPFLCYKNGTVCIYVTG